MAISESSMRLKHAIEKAIVDLKITHAEYEEILAIAEEDGRIDRNERALLNQLQELIRQEIVLLLP